MQRISKNCYETIFVYYFAKVILCDVLEVAKSSLVRRGSKTLFGKIIQFLAAHSFFLKNAVENSFLWDDPNLQHPLSEVSFCSHKRSQKCLRVISFSSISRGRCVDVQTYMRVPFWKIQAKNHTTYSFLGL